MFFGCGPQMLRKRQCSRSLQSVFMMQAAEDRRRSDAVAAASLGPSALRASTRQSAALTTGVSSATTAATTATTCTSWDCRELSSSPVLFASQARCNQGHAVQTPLLLSPLLRPFQFNNLHFEEVVLSQVFWGTRPLGPRPPTGPPSVPQEHTTIKKQRSHQASSIRTRAPAGWCRSRLREQPGLHRPECPFLRSL